jgi:hypothetical protein
VSEPTVKLTATVDVIRNQYATPPATIVGASQKEQLSRFLAWLYGVGFRRGWASDSELGRAR